MDRKKRDYDPDSSLLDWVGLAPPMAPDGEEEADLADDFPMREPGTDFERPWLRNIEVDEAPTGKNPDYHSRRQRILSRRTPQTTPYRYPTPEDREEDLAEGLYDYTAPWRVMGDPVKPPMRPEGQPTGILEQGPKETIKPGPPKLSDSGGYDFTLGPSFKHELAQGVPPDERPLALSKAPWVQPYDIPGYSAKRGINELAANAGIMGGLAQVGTLFGKTPSTEPYQKTVDDLQKKHLMTLSGKPSSSLRDQIALKRLELDYKRANDAARLGSQKGALEKAQIEAQIQATRARMRQGDERIRQTDERIRQDSSKPIGTRVAKDGKIVAIMPDASVKDTGVEGMVPAVGGSVILQGKDGFYRVNKSGSQAAEKVAGIEPKPSASGQGKEVEVREAEARAKNRMKMFDEWQRMYDSTEWKGPTKGLVGKLGNMAGISMGSDFNVLNKEIGEQAAAYLHELSGAAASEAERRRISELIPRVSEDAELFKDSMKVFKKRIQNMVNEKRQGLGKEILDFDSIEGVSSRPGEAPEPESMPDPRAKPKPPAAGTLPPLPSPEEAAQMSPDELKKIIDARKAARGAK